MRLLSLSAEHFRCIRSARVQFGPGLNVLHGPNDLGKSSLAMAIRAALLLQAASREHEAFLDWSGGGDPQVELVFETEPQRIWRVRKTFATSGAQAFLDESRNGVDFQVEARGREVDGRLSEILRWGLAPPGGKGRPKGLPVTFLSTALLAEQDRVGAILENGLAADSDESAKKRLIEALQAVAEDPLYKTVLSSVQERVDEAFSSTGRKRLGKNSPWVRIREEIVRADEYRRQCSEQSQKTVAIEIELQQLRDQQLERKGALENAATILEQIESSHARGRLRKEILGRLADCNGRLSEITQTRNDLAEAENRHRELVRQVTKLRERGQSAKEALAAASQNTQAAKEGLALLQSEDRERDRLLKQTSLEKRRAELQTATKESETALERVRAVEAASRRVQAAADECRSLAEQIETLAEKHQKAKDAVRQANEHEQTLRSIVRLFHWKDVREGIEEAKNGLAQVTAWREEIARQRTAAVALEAEYAKLSLPSAAQLEGIRQLEHQLQVARAGISVGLRVEVRPKRRMKVSVRRDDEVQERHALSDAPLDVSATRHVLLDLEGIAEIALSGGAEEARTRADRLWNQWLAEGEPVLQRAGAANVGELAGIAARAAQLAQEAAEARRAAEQLEQRITDQRDWASLLASRNSELVAAEESLGKADTTALEKAARNLGVVDRADAEKRSDLGRVECSKLEEIERNADGELTGAKATSTEKQKTLASAREELVRGQAFIDGAWREVLPAVLARTAALKAESEDVKREIETLSLETNRTLSEAQNAVAAAERLLEAADEAQDKAEASLRDGEKRQATSEGELNMRREAAAKLDETAARLAVEQVQAELRQVPEPASEITDEVLDQAREMVQHARNHLREIEGDIQSKRGALEHIGGEVAKERAEEAEDALHRARQREQELEMDYAAWDLLRSTLRDAEQQEGVHLGRALGDPIARRFSDLTDRRYGPVSLGPDLETHGISASGDARLVSALSVGTRDQLSTIFRLSLAEQLQTAIVLDDQLTQSDMQRMAWLRDLIRQLAANIQILVFTCRPGDYLLPAELKQGKKTEPAASFVRSIDLGQVIERSGVVSVAHIVPDR